MVSRITSIGFASAFLTAAFLSGSAWATSYTPTQQQRAISAIVDMTSGEESQHDEQQDEAQDFGPYVNTVSATVSMFDKLCGATASQDSAFETDLIRATGVIGLNAQGGGGISSEASGSSLFSVTFTITNPVDYLLTGTVVSESSGDTTGSAGVTLNDGLNDLVNQTADNSVFFLNETGTLLPGTYTFEAFAGSSSSAGDLFESSGASGSFDVQLSFIPEPATALALALGALVLRRR